MVQIVQQVNIVLVFAKDVSHLKLVFQFLPLSPVHQLLLRVLLALLTVIVAAIAERILRRS